MKLVDSHCHLDFESFSNDLDDVLARAADAGVGTLLTIGTHLSTFQGVLSIAAKYEHIYCTVGVHPHEADSEGLDDPAPLLEQAAHPKVVGIGETGLDYYYDHSDREAQRQSFRTHIAAARTTGLPLIVHTREADEDTVAILREEYESGPFTGLIHCFTASQALADAVLEIGFYISFSGILTFRNATDLHETARTIPSDRILVETDAPYLAPVPHRGKRNEPAYVAHTAAFLAGLRGEQTETIARQTTDNFFRLFAKIGAPGGEGEMMRITVLGCGGSDGVPLIGGPDGKGDWGACDPANPKNRRTRASVLVETEGTTILVDTSPDLREQALQAGLKQIDGVIYSHEHADHSHGIHELRRLGATTGKGPVPVYADHATLSALRTRFAYAFDPPDSSPYPPILSGHPFEGPFGMGNVKIAPLEQDHGFGQKTYGFRIEDVCYSTDVFDFPEKSIGMLRDLRLWIVDCQQYRPHPTHSHFEKTLGWIDTFRPERAILTHMGPDMDYETVLRSCPAGVEPAYDGMVLEL